MIVPVQRIEPGEADHLPSAPLSITCSGEAAEVFHVLLRQIPAGYTVALLGDGEDIGEQITPDVDVVIVAFDPAGVAYRNLDERGEPAGPIRIKAWEAITRVHVY